MPARRSPRQSNNAIIQIQFLKNMYDTVHVFLFFARLQGESEVKAWQKTGRPIPFSKKGTNQIMDKLLQKASAMLAALGGFLFGELNGLFYALLACMTLDVLSGVLTGIASHRLSSEIGFRGLSKKLLILVLVCVGHILDAQLFGGGSLVRSAVEGFYIANEGLSILENAGTLGVPLPDRLRAVLLQLQNQKER